LLRYWWHSAPDRHDRISKAYARLIAKATSEHDVLIREAGADNLVQRSGYHSLRRTQAALDEVAAVAETLAAEFGVRSEIISPAQLAAAEPGLNETGAGAVHWRDPWTVSDPGGLVSAYADLFTHNGGTFVNGDAATLAATSAGWTVQSNNGPIAAEAAVVSLGPWSPDLLQRFDYRFPMLRKRGYHRHFSGGGRLNLPLHDPEFAYAMAPMAKGLRITSGAELMGPERLPQSRQLDRAEQAARRVRACVARALAAGVRAEPARHVHGDAGVQAAVAALDQVQPPAGGGLGVHGVGRPGRAMPARALVQNSCEKRTPKVRGCAAMV